MLNSNSENETVSPPPLPEGDVLEREHVLKVYDAIASHFSSTRYKAWPKVQAFIESLPKYAIVADVGCGNGKYFACAQHYRVTPPTDNNNNNNNNNNNDNNSHTTGDMDHVEKTEPAYRYVVGIDSSEGLLRLAQQKETSSSSSSSSSSLIPTLTSTTLTRMCIPRTDLLRADARRTALRSNVFDAAISIAVIHHFATHEGRVAAVQELLRLVRPSGRVLISVWAKEQPKKRSRDNAADVLIPWEMHEIHDKDRRVYQRYYHLFASGELEQLVEEAGAVVQQSYYDKENWCVIIQPAV